MMTVYCIRRKGDTAGPIKIGFASNFEKRRKALSTATPEGFDVLALIEAGRGVERALHAELADFRVGGEWFAPSSEVLAAIEKARTGQYDHEDNHAGPRPIISEPTAELEAPIVDETRFYLNELIKREFTGAGDTTSAARDRVMQAAELSPIYGRRLWFRSQELNDVPGQVYRNLRIAYALAVESEGTINSMQAKFLEGMRRIGAVV
jgi:hypothetical protein